jgi:hypothetical protein
VISAVLEDDYLLGYNGINLCRQWPVFQRDLLETEYQFTAMNQVVSTADSLLTSLKKREREIYCTENSARYTRLQNCSFNQFAMVVICRRE